MRAATTDRPVGTLGLAGLSLTLVVAAVALGRTHSAGMAQVPVAELGFGSPSPG